MNLFFLVIPFSNAYILKEFIKYDKKHCIRLNKQWLNELIYSEKRYPKFLYKDISDAQNIINENYDNNKMLYLGWIPNIKIKSNDIIYQIIAEIIPDDNTLSIYKILLNPLYTGDDISIISLRHDLCDLAIKYDYHINFRNLYDDDYIRWKIIWNNNNL